MIQRLMAERQYTALVSISRNKNHDVAMYCDVGGCIDGLLV